ncbi:phosphotransferase system eiib component type 2/3 [Lucifera butyrica]|uniref:Phosphotransferase system eiib component type 2/3 n=1 Tax=Lucifera butyrica TaxID=1351585 RepID=A0A498R309_9FIRM|nr:PTS sugar transporter subunit IIB [Lucifera butyrica]VBB05160.1 phosphotransferase system eiib component type 2/3 [Lucifera butyrica]
MKRIMLVCSSGMSTSLLVDKMNQAAAVMGVDAEINAAAEADFYKHVNQVDVLLLGPQVKFLLEKMKNMLEPKGIAVGVIDRIDYGTMNGENVLRHALNLGKKEV